MLSRTVHYLYTLLTGHAVAFAVAGFFLFTGLFAGAATGEAIAGVNAMGWWVSVPLCLAACAVCITCMVSPLLAPVTLAVSFLYGFNVGYRLPLLNIAHVTDIPSAFLGGFGSLLSCAALCAACTVSIGRSCAWMKGVRIPAAERFGRMLPEIGAVMLFMLLYAMGSVFAGFVY